jgi:cytochrome c
MTNTYFHSWLAAAAFGAAVAAPLAAQAGDPSTGRSVFKSQCGICHSPSEGKNVVGPSLFGVVGRHTASVTGFHYSVGNQNANLNWDEATLDKYLDSPKAIVPGTAMNFGGIKDSDKRADVIAYLATLK